MGDPLTFFSLAGRVFAVPIKQIHGLRRLHTFDVSSAPSLQVIDLRTWLDLPETHVHKMIVVDLGQRQVGLLVESILDLRTEPAVMHPLPSLLTFAGCDPALNGVILLDDALALVLDLEVLALRLSATEELVGDGGI